MRGGALPLALLFTGLSLALTRLPRASWAPSLVGLAVSLGASLMLPIPAIWLEPVYFGCWVSVMATAATVYLSRELRRCAGTVLSFNVGFWAGAMTSLSGSRLPLWDALPCVLLMLPATSIPPRYRLLPVRIVASWIIVVAALAATLQLLPVTPGYLPDHME
jgi:hypothetical protein